MKYSKTDKEKLEMIRQIIRDVTPTLEEVFEPNEWTTNGSPGKVIDALNTVLIKKLILNI